MTVQRSAISATNFKISKTGHDISDTNNLLLDPLNSHYHGVFMSGTIGPGAFSVVSAAQKQYVVWFNRNYAALPFCYVGITDQVNQSGLAAGFDAAQWNSTTTANIWGTSSYKTAFMALNYQINTNALIINIFYSGGVFYNGAAVVYYIMQS